MKRQILFRGKRSEDGEWMYGYLIGNSVIVGEVVDFDDDYVATEFHYMVDYETVGMFTGMYDNTKWENAPEYHKVYAYNLSEINGTKPKDEWKGIMIFEGDIVSISYPRASFEKHIPSNIGMVRYLDCLPRFMIMGDVEPNCVAISSFCNTGEEWEVIGNIYETPELLKP